EGLGWLPVLLGRRLHLRAEERVRLAIDLRVRKRGRDPGRVRRSGGPVPPGKRRVRGLVAQRQLKEVEIRTVPREEEGIAPWRVAVLAVPIRQPVQTGEVLIAAVVGDHVVADLVQAGKALTQGRQ